MTTPIESSLTPSRLAKQAKGRSWEIKIANGIHQEPDILLSFIGSYDDAWDAAYNHIASLPNPIYYFVVGINPKRGGARPGAGNKANPQKEKTKTVRVPVSVAEKFKEVQHLLALIEDWKEREADSVLGSRDWTRCRQFLAEIEEVLNPKD